jgi:hypothetical protein
MTTTEWRIKGTEIVNCNCDFSCPCQFNALPTHGNCEAAVAVHIDKGHHGSVKLDGLTIAASVVWPGPIHMGGGVIQPIVDERASEEQRQTLLRIMSGEDTDPGATFFQVFSATYEKVLPPIFRKIDFSADVESRKGRFKVPGVVESETTPIINPVTGAEHRVRVTLPQGFEYHEAEYASAKFNTDIPQKLAIDKGHAHLARIEMTGHGVVH